MNTESIRARVVLVQARNELGLFGCDRGKSRKSKGFSPVVTSKGGVGAESISESRFCLITSVVPRCRRVLVS